VYRVSLDQPLWAVAIANGTVVPAKDFQGRPGCDAPHKDLRVQAASGEPDNTSIQWQ